MKRRSAYAAALVAAGLLAAIPFCGPGVPSFEAVRERWRPSDAQLLDRHGEPIHELRVDAHGRRLAWTPLAAISPALQEAVIASEDTRFCGHRGLPPVTRASFCVTERCSAYEIPQSANLRGSGTALGLSGRGEARLGWDNGPRSPYSVDILQGTASALAIQTGNNQTGRPGQALTLPLTATVTDTSGPRQRRACS